MKQYEYKVEQIHIELKHLLKHNNNSKWDKEVMERLNSLGNEGWELAGVDGALFYFKKEVQSNNE